MSTEATTPTAPCECECYAFRESRGVLDIESIGETPEIVRDRMLADVMGWRYEHPDRYSHDESWNRILKTGTVVKVSVTEIDV